MQIETDVNEVDDADDESEPISFFKIHNSVKCVRNAL